MIKLNNIVNFSIPNTNKQILLNDNFKITDSTKSVTNRVQTQQKSIAVQNNDMIQSISALMSKQISTSIITSAKNNLVFVPVIINSTTIDNTIKSYPGNKSKFTNIIKTHAVIEKIKSIVKIKIRDSLLEELIKNNITNTQISTIMPSGGFII